MNLTLKGHDYRYAVEQIMIMMFPNERPLYAFSEESALSAVVSLKFGDVYATAFTRIETVNGIFNGISRVKRTELTDKLTAARLQQKIIKLSFYKAAIAATGGKQPVWGALTGIRPGKIVTGMLERGFSHKKALHVLSHDYFVSPERGALCIETAKAGLQTQRTLCERDIALYIGIPFCPSRCHYCSFVSHSVEKSMKLIQPFLETLYREIEALSSIVDANDLNIISVYIGGGTPTTLSAEQLDGLMKKLAVSFNLNNVREYTVEAGRPDTITTAKLDVLYNSGVTRISINPQTMSDDVLRTIGRRHSSQEVLDAMRASREAGFNFINMDLIAGLPDDSAENFKNSLETVLSLNPENITIHTLSLKKGTRVTLDSMIIPDGQEVARMLDVAGDLLRSRGYVPYYLYRQKFISGGFENIGWCRPGFISLYNILIMEELATILALGGGSVTKLVSQKTRKIERIFNPKYPYEYIKNIDRIIENKFGITRFYADAQNFPLEI